MFHDKYENTQQGNLLGVSSFDPVHDVDKRDNCVDNFADCQCEVINIEKGDRLGTGGGSSIGVC